MKFGQYLQEEILSKSDIEQMKKDAIRLHRDEWMKKYKIGDYDDYLRMAKREVGLSEEVEYKNPWWDKNKDAPRSFKTNVKPEEYKGFHIYHRIKDESDPTFKLGKNVFDIVYQGKLVSQMAGPNGAKKAIDTNGEEFKTFAKSQLKEDEKSQKMVDTAFKKAHHDINQDSPPVNLKAAAKMGISEEKEVSSLIIKIEFGNETMQSSVDAEIAIKDAFKRYRLGSGGAKFVKIYDEDGNSVGSLEVK